MTEKEKEKESVQNVFEKYFNEEYQREYYYNPFTQESKWEMPENSTIIDKTEAAKVAVVDEVQEYKDRMARLEKLQQESLQSLYPEFYQASADEAVRE